jgi:hypothetical protein
MDRCPDPLVQIIPGNLGHDLETGNRPCDFDPARHEPADRKCIERPQRPPTDGLENGPRMRLYTAKYGHPAQLLERDPEEMKIALSRGTNAKRLSKVMIEQR